VNCPRLRYDKPTLLGGFGVLEWVVLVGKKNKGLEARFVKVYWKKKTELTSVYEDAWQIYLKSGCGKFRKDVLLRNVADWGEFLFKYDVGA
jgi:hypothetical protein